MAFTIKGLVSDGTLPTSAKANLASDIGNTSSTIRTALNNAGLGKGSTDAEIAAFVADGASATGSALSSRFALKGDTGASGTSGVIAERIATMADFASGNVNIGVATDSTGNDGNDYVFNMLRLLSPTLPANVGVKHVAWVDSTKTWGTPTTVKAGAESAATGGTVMSDDFNRTGNVVGSTSSGGQVWAGTSGAWTMDGAKASTLTNGAMSFNTGSRDTTMTATFDVVTGTTASPNWRFYVGSATSGLGDGVWGQLAISSNGTANLSVWKRIGGVNTSIVAQDFSTGFVANSATPQTGTITVKLAIQAVTVTMVSPGATLTKEATITETDYAALGTFAGVTGSTVATLPIDSITMETPATPGTMTGLTVYNGAVPGTTLQYHQDNLAAMFPSSLALDGLLVAGGHNYGTDSPSVFLGKLGAYITAFRGNHPNTPVVLSSQNPQKSPSGTVAAHAARQAAARVHATTEGWEYIPAYEAFKAQPDGGDSLLQSDGIHPTVPTPGQTPPGFGAVLWAQTWLDQINAHRRI